MILILLLIQCSLLESYECKTDTDCSMHGICSTMTNKNLTEGNNITIRYCKCDSEYATFPINNYPECNYKRLSKVTVFGFELLLGWCLGLGMYYVGDVTNGNCSMLLFLIGIFLIIFLEKYRRIQIILLRVWFIIMIGYWLYRLIIILIQDIQDINGVSIY